MKEIWSAAKAYWAALSKHKKYLLSATALGFVGVGVDVVAFLKRWPSDPHAATPIIFPLWVPFAVWALGIIWAQAVTWYDEYKAHKADAKTLNKDLQTVRDDLDSRNTQVGQLERELAKEKEEHLAEKERNREPVVALEMVEGELCMRNSSGFDVFDVSPIRLVRAGHVVIWDSWFFVAEGQSAPLAWQVVKSDGSVKPYHEPLKTFASRECELEKPNLAITINFHWRGTQWQSNWFVTFHEDAITFDPMGSRPQPPPIPISQVTANLF